MLRRIMSVLTRRGARAQSASAGKIIDCAIGVGADETRTCSANVEPNCGAWDERLPRRSTRRILLRGAVSAGVITAAAFVNRYALGNIIRVRLARVAYLSATDREAFDVFVSQLMLASGNTIAVSLDIPFPATAPELISAIERDEFSGILGSPDLFADLHGIYSEPEPGYRLIGDTLGSFETQDQQLEWIYSERGLSAARRVYSAHGLVFVAAIPTAFIGRLLTRFAPREVSDLTGRDIALRQSFVADLLQSYGITVRYVNSITPPFPIGPALELVGGEAELRIDTAQSGSLFLISTTPVTMPLYSLVLGSKQWSQFSPEQKALFQEYAKQFSRSVAETNKRADERWLRIATNTGASLQNWNRAQRIRWHMTNNLFLRHWARGGPTSRVEVVDSIEAQQRQFGLVE